MRHALDRNAFARLLSVWLLGLAALASFSPALAADPAPADSPPAPKIANMISEYDRLSLQFDEEEARFEAAKKKFLKSHEQREHYAKADGVDVLLKEGTELTFQVDLRAVEDHYNNLRSLRAKIAALEDAVDEILLPELARDISPSDQEAIGRREEAMAWAEKRFGPGMMISPAREEKPAYQGPPQRPNFQDANSGVLSI